MAKMCSEKGIDVDKACDDQTLTTVLSVIRHKNDGVVATLGKYGRGVDIRFNVDSLVIIGYIPPRFDSVT